MTRYVFKMPDLGEGTVEAEVVAWHVKVGDFVTEDQVIAEVMTEKAAVELPSPVTGRVLSQTGAPGDMVPVGADLIVFDTDSGEERRTKFRPRHRPQLPPRLPRRQLPPAPPFRRCRRPCPRQRGRG